jgi:hypothetical protein
MDSKNTSRNNVDRGGTVSYVPEVKERKNSFLPDSDDYTTHSYENLKHYHLQFSRLLFVTNHWH